MAASLLCRLCNLVVPTASHWACTAGVDVGLVWTMRHDRSFAIFL